MNAPNPVIDIGGERDMKRISCVCGKIGHEGKLENDFNFELSYAADKQLIHKHKAFYLSYNVTRQ